MTSTSKRLLVAVLAVVLTLSVATLGITAFAVTTTDTIEYPFAKGDNAFKYAPTWQGAEKADTYKSMSDAWQFFQIKFAKNLNLDDFDYLALQGGSYKWNVVGYVGPSDTGWNRNHNPGMVRSALGYVPSSNKIGVVVSTGNNDWPNENIFTYRLFGHWFEIK